MFPSPFFFVPTIIIYIVYIYIATIQSTDKLDSMNSSLTLRLKLSYQNIGNWAFLPSKKLYSIPIILSTADDPGKDDLQDLSTIFIPTLSQSLYVCWVCMCMFVYRFIWIRFGIALCFWFRCFKLSGLLKISGLDEHGEQSVWISIYKLEPFGW